MSFLRRTLASVESAILTSKQCTSLTALFLYVWQRFCAITQAIV